MKNETRLDRTLKSLAAQDSGGLPDDFMDGVWRRAGQLSKVRDQRQRATYLLGFFVIGLGAGLGTTQAPAFANTPKYALLDSKDLSPASLLKVEP